MRDEIRLYEKNFAEWFNGRKAFSFWKGRVSLYAILKAAGVSQGDEIILPGYTCVVDINPIRYLGSKPVYVDIEPHTFNINPQLLEKKITKNTKVIIAQHTYGYPCDMDAIMDIAARKDITVIEDCCLAFGSKYRGKLVGTFGAAAYFSFQWNKFYTTGLGGMVLANDPRLVEKIASLSSSEAVKPSKTEVMMLAAQLLIHRLFIYPRTTALAQNLFRTLTKRGVVVGSSKYDEYAGAPAEPDFFKKMSAMQAWYGMRQLCKTQRNIEHRRRMAIFYDNLLDKKGWPTRQFDTSVIEPVMVRYPVRIVEKEKAIHEAAGAGIELGNWFNSTLHQIETSPEVYGYKIGSCPQAEKAAREVVNLPLHMRANEKTAEKTVDFITKFTMAK